MKLWGGRFNKPTDVSVEHYASSLAVDQRLAQYDILGSMAHAKMLVKAKLLTVQEGRQLARTLKLLLSQCERGTIALNPEAEDVHTAIQELLDQHAGAAARKLHTARSRNDQVALDARLYCKAEIAAIQALLQRAQKALVEFAKRHHDIVIPGYTHLQRAQAVLLAHHLLAYVEMLERDRARLSDVYTRVDVLPAGSCALAGTTLPIDRHYEAKLLGFARVSDNSMDAVADRDFVVELLAALALLAMHLSRLAEDFILWCSDEFGLLQIDDAFATGSSAMPHKKNPDVLELVRGSTGRLYGDLTSVLTTMKGLPLTYNRDMQWDKVPLFDAVDVTCGNLEMIIRLMSHLTINATRAAELVHDDTLCATEMAEYLVRKGLAFQEAHRVVGHVVRLAAGRGQPLREVPLEELRQLAPEFDEEIYTWLNAQAAVAGKQSHGGTGPGQVQRALARWERALK